MRDTTDSPEHATPPATAEMTAEAIDAVLADLAEVSDLLVAECAAAHRELDERNDEDERWLTRGAHAAGQRSCPHPKRALTSLRLTHAIHHARHLRRSSRELVAWWADLATYVALSTAAGEPINPVRAAGADPSAYLEDEELRHLPGPSEEVRTLARLAAFFVDTPQNLGAIADAPRLDAREFAARAGLALQRSATGDVTVVDDPFPDARMRRMWGDTWIDHQMPLLLPSDELATAFTNGGVPATVVDAIRTASLAVDEVLGAAYRIARLRDVDSEECEPGLSAEEEALWAYVDRSTDVLAEYARTLTDHLPAIRTAARQRIRR
ncbi:hypothetical protein OG792_14800 [Micromonospora sp. NBC_01699]|uniref:hypothetical protein n=1 Tax=Micromonospora sp. NBC_01699 TaxID=2975984 RepID=UPI002E2F18EC|nr:hypothetical protein [Micromonospora sp. NBC_01699]